MNKQFHSCILVFVVLLTASFQLSAQNLRALLSEPEIDPQERFIRLGTDEGLSHRTVTDILQDTKGYIWIATVSGLNKFDGTSFKVYNRNPDDTKGFADGNISCLVLDSTGVLYAGSEHGFYHYVPGIDSFRLISMKKSLESDVEPYIRGAVCGRDNTLWLDTYSGKLLRYFPETGTTEVVLKHTKEHQRYYRYHPMFMDGKNNLWWGGRGLHPMWYNLKTKESDYLKTYFYLYDDDDLHYKRSDVTGYYEDDKGVLWILGTDGIFYYDKPADSIKKLRRGTTYQIFTDSKKNIWVATAHGLEQINKKDNRLLLYKNNKFNKNSVSGNYIYKLMEDSFGNIWIGTDNGISIYPRRQNGLQSFREIPDEENTPSGNYVTAVTEDNEGNLWIGYKSDGLDFFERYHRHFISYKTSNKIKNSLADNHINSLYTDSDGDIWIGLWSGTGFQIYYPKTKTFETHTFEPDNLTKDWYEDFAEDGNGRMLLGFWGADGIRVFDKKRKKFGKDFLNELKRSDYSRLTTCMITAHDGTVWFGTTDGGLHHLFPGPDTITAYFSDKNSRGLHSNEVKGLTFDKKGGLWIAGKVLQKYIPAKDTFITIESSSLPENLTGIACDSSNILWIATENNGVFSYNPETNKFNRFTTANGLLSNHFTGAVRCLSDKSMFLGTDRGFHIVPPGGLTVKQKLPVPFFGYCRINNRLRYTESNLPKQITLKPGDKFFSLKVNCSDMAQPANYIYQYKLRGFDDQWIKLPKNNFTINLSNIPPGKYELLLLLGDENRHWSPKPASLSILVLAPFYKTKLFYVFLLLSFVILVILIINRREKELKQQYQNLEIRQQLFRLQINPHFFHNTLSSIQSYIFNNDREKAVNYMSYFANLFRTILNNSQKEFISLEEEIETLRLYLNLQQLRHPGKFDFEFHIDESIETDLIMMPPMLAQPIIENALEHGIFKKEEKGLVSISIVKKKSELLIDITDNGIGIENTISLSYKDRPSALQITKNRLNILEKKYKYRSSFMINAIRDDNEKIAGTRVTFRIPLKYKSSIF